MSKYKVGDKVKVREDLVVGEKYGKHIAIDDMVEFKGKEVTIKTVIDNNFGYGIEETNYTWTNEMFEGLVDEIKPSFKIGDTVEIILIHFLDGGWIQLGETAIISKLGTSGCDIVREGKIDFYVYYNQIKLIKEAPQLVEETSEPMSIPNKGTIKYRTTDNGITYITLNGHNSGKSIKSDKDESSNEIGILLSVARSLGFNEDKISGIVDVLFDDDSYNSKAKCENAIIKNDIARALSILDKHKEV